MINTVAHLTRKGLNGKTAIQLNIVLKPLNAIMRDLLFRAAKPINGIQGAYFEQPNTKDGSCIVSLD